MKLSIHPDYDTMSRAATQCFAQQILKKPDSNLCLATGKTPLGFYRNLVDMTQQGIISFSQTRCFHLDEYLGLSLDDARGFFNTLDRVLFSKVDVQPDQLFRLSSARENNEQTCLNYEKMLQRYEIDLLLLGIGINGHIAFNEPGSSWDSQTRLVNLSEITRNRAKAEFNPDPVPTQALTMGIKTILRAKKILVLSSGSEKADMIAESFYSPIDVQVPASILQLHPNVDLILDEQAASIIQTKIEKNNVIKQL